MSKSGLADSPFFALTQPIVEPITPPPADPHVEKVEPAKIEKPKIKKVGQPIKRDTTTPSNHDTTVSRYHDTIIELVRKSVKEFGKEAATHRFTLEEKRAVADIIYTYKNSGIKTSENEIARISVNFIIEDYRENGANSILHKILEVLNE
jgi:hypothetical protein